MVLPLECLALVASFVEPHCIGSMAMASRQMSSVVDRLRYTSPRITSAKDFAKLCSIITHRPAVASYCRSLVFDWKTTNETHQQFLPLAGLIQIAIPALAQATKLKTFTFLTLPPATFIEFLANFQEELSGVTLLEYGAVDTPFDYGRLDREDLLSTILVALTKLSSVHFLSTVPRSLLHPAMQVIGNKNSPLIETVALAVPHIDFGVIQELTLQSADLETKRERPCLSDISVLGDFSCDPYAPNSTFLKDTPAVLRRLPLLSRLAFIVPTSPVTRQWACSESVFLQEQCFLDRLGSLTTIGEVVFPSGNRWNAVVELGCDLVKWEPADLTAKDQDVSVLEQWWWSSDASTGLVEVAPCESLVASRPMNVAPPPPWKTPYAASSPSSSPNSEEVLMGGGYMCPRYIPSRATTPAPIDIEVDDLVLLPRHDDSDDDDDEHAMRLFDAELDLLDDPRSSMEPDVDVGVSSLSWDPDDDEAMGSDDEEMIALKNRLSSSTPVPPRHEDSDEEDESSDIDEDSDDERARSRPPHQDPHAQHARPMLRKHILPPVTGGTVSPQEVTSSLFEMVEEGEAALQLHKPSTWTAPATGSGLRQASPSESEDDEDEMEMVVINEDVPEELEELAASWTTPLNLAKRRMALYL